MTPTPESNRNPSPEPQLEADTGSVLRFQVLSAIVSGFLCTIVSHPDDVVKTRMQTHIARHTPEYAQYRTYAQTLRTVVVTEGFRALWRGAFFRCVIRVPLGLTVIALVSTYSRPHVARAVEGSRTGAG